MTAHLESKRGVMSGVGPIIKEESIILLAGVTNAFLLDLKPDRRVRHDRAAELERWREMKENAHRLTVLFCVPIVSALALFDVVGGFLVALPWIGNKQLNMKRLPTSSNHPLHTAIG